jgi:hypothetical protein
MPAAAFVIDEDPLEAPVMALIFFVKASIAFEAVSSAEIRIKISLDRCMITYLYLEEAVVGFADSAACLALFSMRRISSMTRTFSQSKSNSSGGMSRDLQ